jgi:hypothetical protein
LPGFVQGEFLSGLVSQYVELYDQHTHSSVQCLSKLCY